MFSDCIGWYKKMLGEQAAKLFTVVCNFYYFLLRRQLNQVT
jgi:hypothetical protein